MTYFDEYKKPGEPEKVEKSENWRTAIGLQEVDGLKPSEYLLQTAKKNIDGDITFDEVKNRLDTYYKTKSVRMGADDRTEEADKVSARIAELLSEKAFTFSPAELIGTHLRLFSGIYAHAGKIRDYNITKAEWVLDGATVYYASAGAIRATLDYDFAQEKAFTYKGLTKAQIAEHIAKFVSGIWQIHAFGEGNTRAVAVFTIKYLRSFGFNVNNDLFAEHSWFFRNALVRANFNDLTKGIHATSEFLNRFFGNLLLGEKNVLKNRELKAVCAEDAARPRDTLNDTLGANDTMNDTLKFIAANPNATQEQISKGVGKSVATVKRATTELQKQGRLERKNGKRNGYWVVKL